jgi:hydroxymethylglutaryl-CoA reductase
LSKIRVELNYAGVGELLKSQEIADTVKEVAEQVAARAGDGYATDVYQTGTRVIASVYTETEEAMKDNIENNTLLKAVSGS